MSDYILSCSSTADYPREFFENRNIHYTCFHYQMDGKTYPDDLYARITPHEFFSQIKAGSQPTTSQIAAGEYVESWKPYLQAGTDVLHVTLSSGISGTYNSACVARDEMLAKYPERKVIVIDSLAASSGYGLLMEYMADLRDTGMGIDELADWCENNKMKLNHWFFVSDLECLKRGGRVSKTSALIATALKICPVLNVDYQGKLIPREKIRTKKKAIEGLVQKCLEHIDNGSAYTGKCCLCHSDCLEDAQQVAKLIGKRIPALKGNIAIYDIGTVIGSHTGPGTVALFFMGDARVD